MAFCFFVYHRLGQAAVLGGAAGALVPGGFSWRVQRQPSGLFSSGFHRFVVRSAGRIRGCGVPVSLFEYSAALCAWLQRGVLSLDPAFLFLKGPATDPAADETGLWGPQPQRGAGWRAVE